VSKSDTLCSREGGKTVAVRRVKRPISRDANRLRHGGFQDVYFRSNVATYMHGCGGK
jgi:hypothetical protein